MSARQAIDAALLDEIRHALEIGRMGGPYSDIEGYLYMNERYKSHPGADAKFTDYGLAHAACVLFNNADALLALLPVPSPPNHRSQSI